MLSKGIAGGKKGPYPIALNGLVKKSLHQELEQARRHEILLVRVISLGSVEQRVVKKKQVQYYDHRQCAHFSSVGHHPGLQETDTTPTT
jgi:hypothetical protein